MRNFRNNIITLLLIALLSISVTTANAQIRVMPLGNSITRGTMCINGDITGCILLGDADAIGYRDSLYNLLSSAGYDFDFVGSENFGGAVMTDTDNAGFNGISDSQLATLMETGTSAHTGVVTPGPYLESHPADIILLHIGTNDVLALDYTVGGVDRILDAIDDYETSAGNPIMVFLARIISRRDSACNTDDGIVAFNAALDALVTTRTAGGDNIIVVDMECGAGIDYSLDMIDQLHPNQDGYDKMADTWFAAIDVYLKAIPAAPSDLTFTPITYNSIQLNWVDNSNNETGFEIRRSLSSGGPYALITTRPANTLSWDNTGLAAETEYFYRVNAVNGTGTSVSISGSATTLASPPIAPDGLVASATTVCSVDLVWRDRSDNEDGFEIERSASPLSTFTLIGTVTTGIESFTDTDTENNLSYYYRVRAFNATDYSTYSAVEFITVSVVLNGGTIGVDQSICPGGDPGLIANIVSPSGGSNNWSYQWQSRVAPAPFSDIPGASGISYNPPAGITETTEYKRISTVECGWVESNVVTITVEDIEDPVFTVCPTDMIVAIDRDQISETVTTMDPVTTDNCGIDLLTWSLSGATTGSSPVTGINYVGTYTFNLGVTTVNYHMEDITGNSVECSFDIEVELLPPEILNVTIPNATMKIGDVISATISVTDDRGISYTMFSGEIGDYPLYNFQRINATTYLANFEIIESGNSYLAIEDIPVSNLIITVGIEQSLSYNTPISQGNDMLDAELPVINSITAQAGIFGIGGVVILDINANEIDCDIHPSSTINGLLVSESNITFSELGAGFYRLYYTVEEDNNDVGPGELLATVILVKPSGNVGLPYSIVDNIASVIIDAHPPVISQMEVPDDEIGIGQTVQVTITADEEGYTASFGTLINGVPLSSLRVSFSERTGGLYEMSYIVDVGDANVAPGNLAVSLVMTDLAGNASDPYLIIQTNTLEVYTELPIALIAGTPEICQEESAELTVFLGGRSPWSFDLFDGLTYTTYENITSDAYIIEVFPDQNTTYRITSVRDTNNVENIGNGNVQVIVHDKTDVEIINLASGYSVEADPILLEANISGGTFSGPGVFSGTDVFAPGIADTVNSPHTLYYTYVNANGCVSVDSALVFVLGAEGAIFIPSDIVCDNGDPFEVNASNIAGVIGSFKLLNSSGQTVVGLTDNGDNTAEINPTLLAPGEYTVEYDYLDMIILKLRNTFEVKTAVIPVITNLDKDSYCQSESSFELLANVENAVFEGPGVIMSGSSFIFNPSIVFPGDITITCTVTSESGCIGSTQKIVTILFAPIVDFTLSTTCIPDSGGLVVFENLSSGKLEVDSWNWDFGDPSSGDDNQSDLISPEHFYSSPEERSITLTATAYSGCVVEKVSNVIIGNQPVAEFSWLSDCYVDGSETRFFDRSVSGFSSIDTLIWTFKTQNGAILHEEGSGSQGDTVAYEFSVADNYLVELFIHNTMECSDTIMKVLNLRETIQLGSLDYLEEFDLNDGDWTIESSDQVESWTWDVPNFTDFEQISGDRAWFTDLPDDVIDYRENSWIQSPCFDFSGIKKPTINLDILKSFVPERDGAVLQYQTTKEEGWKTVGDLSTGKEWYNTDSIENEPGGSSTGWGLSVFNPDSEWVTVAHNLDNLKDNPGVTFRIAVGTNGTAGIGNQGFAFDNVLIGGRSKLAVLEYFTNSSDAPSSVADDYVESFVKSYYGDIIDLQYHIDYPGIDPMNRNNPGPPSTRSFNYGIPGVPFAVLDGGISEEYQYDFTTLKSSPEGADLMQLIFQVPAFEIDLDINWMETSLNVTSSITCKVEHYADNIQLYVVIFEASVTAYTGINGDTAYRNVVLDMLPTAAGKLLGDNWYKDITDTRSYSWIYQPYVEDVDDLAVIAFVQDRNTLQILQAAVDFKTTQVGIGDKIKRLEELYLYPNPAKRIVNVNLGKHSEKDGRFEVIDMNGRIVQSEHVPSGYQIYQMDVQSLNRGFYMIQWYEAGVLKGRNKLVKVN